MQSRAEIALGQPRPARGERGMTGAGWEPERGEVAGRNKFAAVPRVLNCEGAADRLRHGGDGHFARGAPAPIGRFAGPRIHREPPPPSAVVRRGVRQWASQRGADRGTPVRHQPRSAAWSKPVSGWPLVPAACRALFLASASAGGTTRRRGRVRGEDRTKKSKLQRPAGSLTHRAAAPVPRSSLREKCP